MGKAGGQKQGLSWMGCLAGSVFICLNQSSKSRPAEHNRSHAHSTLPCAKCFPHLSSELFMSPFQCSEWITRAQGQTQRRDFNLDPLVLKSLTQIKPQESGSPSPHPCFPEIITFFIVCLLDLSLPLWHTDAGARGSIQPLFLSYKVGRPETQKLRVNQLARGWSRCLKSNYFNVQRALQVF